MFDKYITHNSDIQNNLRELNENASGNELVIQSTLQNCQKSLTDFINTSMIDIKTSDIISFHLQPQVNRKTQTTGDRNASDYLVKTVTLIIHREINKHYTSIVFRLLLNYTHIVIFDLSV